jgi:hypothetical protein
MLGALGMPTQGLKAEMADRLLGSFYYLETSNEGEPPCLLIYGCDVDLDGEADLRCAVSMDGEVFDCLILSSRWSTLVVGLGDEARPGLPDNDEGLEGAGPGTIGGGTGAPPSNGMADPTPGGADEAPDGDQDGLGLIGADGVDGSDLGAADEALDGLDDDPAAATPPPAPTLNQPLIEHLAIWSFVCAVESQADEAGQGRLASSFRQIDLSFCARYQYSFEYWLADQQGKAPREDVIYNDRLKLEPQIWNYNQNYTLYISDLDSGVRVILYVDAGSGDCMGFTIQESD